MVGSTVTWVRRLGIGLTVAVAVLLLAPAPVAQEVTGPALKAAFLFNFVKFTTWPADALPDGAPLVMCVIDEPAVGDALASSVTGRVVMGHRIQVTQPADPATWRGCHVAYVSGTRAAALRVVEVVADQPVLTASDVHGFNAGGGIAQFHVQQGQLWFAFALDAIKRSRLHISARLLILARRV